MDIAWHMFTGCGTALVTPFRADQSLDEAGVARTCAPSDRGRHRFPCALAAPPVRVPPFRMTNTCALWRSRLKKPRAACRLSPVPAATIRPTSSNSLRELKSIGVAGILSVTPYYNRPTQEGLYQHYRAVAESTTLPIIVYSIQARTGVNVEPATVERLAETAQHCRA